MSRMLQHATRKSNQARALSLGEDAAIPARRALPANLPISPTDSNLSPCSKKIWKQRDLKKTSKDAETGTKAGVKRRLWASSLGEVEDGSGDSDSSGSSDSDSDSDSDDGGGTNGDGEAKEGGGEVVEGMVERLGRVSVDMGEGPGGEAAASSLSAVGDKGGTPTRHEKEDGTPATNMAAAAAAAAGGGGGGGGAESISVATATDGDAVADSQRAADKSHSHTHPQAFFTSPAELNVQPQPSLTALPIVLGSSSANRREVLRRMGWDCEVMAPDIDERAIQDEDSRTLVKLIAAAKADAILDKLSGSGAAVGDIAEGEAAAGKEPVVLITGDQMIEFEGEVRGKPESSEQATTFLKSYSKRQLLSVSGLCVVNTQTSRRAEGVDVAKVSWGEIGDDVISAVVKEGSCQGSAGGFRLENQLLQPCVDGVEGSVDSVWGMPVDLLVRLMEEVMQPL